MDIMKTCKLCNTSKSINEYYKNKNTGFYHCNCLQCVLMNNERTIRLTGIMFLK